MVSVSVTVSVSVQCEQFYILPLDPLLSVKVSVTVTVSGSVNTPLRMSLMTYLTTSRSDRWVLMQLQLFF